jgi:hypothetical protein
MGGKDAQTVAPARHPPFLDTPDLAALPVTIFDPALTAGKQRER